jgi:hypothetical protein
MFGRKKSRNAALGWQAQEKGKRTTTQWIDRMADASHCIVVRYSQGAFLIDNG